MYSLTNPLSTVLLSIDLIRLKSLEEEVDACSSPELGVRVSDKPDFEVADSSPGSVLTLTAS